MDEKTLQKMLFSLYVVDFDYIAVRYLMAGGFFPTVGSLANIVIDRYIKTFLWSQDRNDLVRQIIRWRGNESHNIVRVINICKQEINIGPELSEQEIEVLRNIYKSYCFRYVDFMFAGKDHCEIYMKDMHTIDKICYFFRKKIEEVTPRIEKTPINLLLSGDSIMVKGLSCGNVNMRDLLLFDNPYFK